MQKSTLALALLPPFMALLIEAANPMSDARIEADCDANLPDGLQNTEFFEDTKSAMRVITSAAVEVSGLSPTFAASITSGFAVIHELDKPFWPAICYIMIFASVIVFILWVLSGATLFEIGNDNISIHFSWGLVLKRMESDKGRVTRQDVIRRIIYLSNLFLIVVTGAIFVYQDISHLKALFLGLL